MHRIVTLTLNPAVDRSTSVDHVIPLKKLRCTGLHDEPGGGGINVARAIRRMGGSALAVFTSGGDPGRLLERLLEIAQVDTLTIPVRARTRENLTIEETETRHEFRFLMPGPELTREETAAVATALRGLEPAPQTLVISGSLPPGVPLDWVPRIATEARERGSRVVVDTSGEPLRRACQAGVFMIKPNFGELRAMAGSELAHEAEQDAFVRSLIDQGQAEVVFVSLGAQGALVGWKDGVRRLRAPAVPIRSRVGAGDSTVAGFVLGIERGRSILDAARLGVAAGAAAVMTHGSELCRGEDVERLDALMATDPALAG